MINLRNLLAISVICSIFALSGCGGGGGNRGTIVGPEQTTVDLINSEIQSAGAEWVAAVNPISQLSEAEQKLLNGSLPEQATSERVMMRNSLQSSQLPSSIDWRSKDGSNWLTSIKNQSSCGSCVAFSSLGVVEALYKISNTAPDSDIDLSEAYLFTCPDKDPYGTGTPSCNNGWYKSLAAEWLKNNGTVSETCLPYQPQDNLCQNKCSSWQSQLVTIDSWEWVTNPAWSMTATEKRTLIKNHLIKGPVLSSIKVYQDFNYYKSGTYQHVYGNELGGHAVAIVGYNDSGQYWIVRNSWSTYWGESGYVKIKYGEVEIEDYVIAMQMTGTSAGVVASASPTSVTLSGGQAQTTLTCTANGTISSLEGRCDDSDSWTVISSGSTMVCTYSESGTYTPGCRVNGIVTDVVDTDIQVDAASPLNYFPIQVGNYWKYRSNQVVTDFSLQGEITRTITGTELRNGKNTYVTDERVYRESAYDCTHHEYLVVEENTLYEYDFEEDTSCNNSAYRVANAGTTSAHGFLPVKFVYPPNPVSDWIGMTWSHDVGDTDLFEINDSAMYEVLSSEEITVPAGTFSTYKIRLNYSPEITVDMWFASIGLVKYVVTYDEMYWTDSSTFFPYIAYELVEASIAGAVYNNSLSMSSLTIESSTTSTDLETKILFNATATYSNGKAQDVTKSVQWISSDTNVALMNGFRLAPQSTGTTSVTAYYQYDDVTSNAVNIHIGE